MSNNLNAVKEYLTLIGASDSDLLTEDEQESGFLISPWINYTLESDGYPDGNFLLRFRYKTDSRLFQIQFWGRDFYEEWIGTNKHVFVSLLVNRINNKLNLGSWWLDLDNGTVAIVASLVVSDNGINVDSIKLNVNGLIDTLRKYYPILAKYIMSDGEADDFSHALECLDK